MTDRTKFDFFMDMLQSMGGVFKTFTPEPEDQTGRYNWDDPEPHGFKPLGMKHYRVTARGYICRRVAKRDRSLTARQWKKQRKLAKRVAKAEREARAAGQ